MPRIFDNDNDILAINTDGSINVGGTVTVSNTADTAVLSAQLDTISTGIDNIETYTQSQLIVNDYSRIVQTWGTDTYIAHAQIGTLSGAASWRVQKIDTNGSRTWAGAGAFNQSCSADLSGLTFAY